MTHTISLRNPAEYPERRLPPCQRAIPWIVSDVMLSRSSSLFAVLVALAACATDSHLPSELQPLPEPAEVALAGPDGLCARTVLFDRMDGVRMFGAIPEGQVVEQGQGSSVKDFSGTVLQVTNEVSGKAALQLVVGVPNEAKSWFQAETTSYSVASLSVEGETFYLVARTHSLGLRPGMRFDARRSQRGGIFEDSSRIFTIRSAGEVVWHEEMSTFPPEDFHLPDGVRIAKEKILCHYGDTGAGDVYAMRVTNKADESIVLWPGQGRTLGEYDVYLWGSLFPIEGETKLAGIDAPSSTTAISIARRPTRAD